MEIFNLGLPEKEMFCKNVNDSSTSTHWALEDIKKKNELKQILPEVKILFWGIGSLRRNRNKVQNENKNKFHVL